jgi:hypothetical protein
VSDKKEFPLFNVQIERGKDVLTVAVPEHEVSVLRMVHNAREGSPNANIVRVIGPATVDVDGKPVADTVELNVSADAEYGRLASTYSRINDPDVMGRAFPLGPSQLERFGFEMNRGVAEAPKGSQVKKHGKAKAEAKAAAK